MVTKSTTYGKIEMARIGACNTFPNLTKSTFVEVNMAKFSLPNNQSTDKCQIINCGKPILCKNFCRNHYSKFHKSANYEMGKICSVKTCNSPILARQLCIKHYQRWGKHRDVHRDIHSNESRAERFWAKVNIQANTERCWEWKGAKDFGGYGRTCWDAKNAPAHVIAFKLNGGVLRDGEIVRHKVCRNRPCCNPFHLLAGTSRDNQQDSINDGTKARGSKQGSSKLTDTQVLEILCRYKDGETQCSLAKEYGIHQSQVSNIVNGKYWKHLES